jgi:hypothetical protein
LPKRSEAERQAWQTVSARLLPGYGWNNGFRWLKRSTVVASGPAKPAKPAKRAVTTIFSLAATTVST